MVCRLVRKLVFMPDDAPAREQSLFHMQNSMNHRRQGSGPPPLEAEDTIDASVGVPGDLRDGGVAGTSSEAGPEGEVPGWTQPGMRRSASFSDYESQARGCAPWIPQPATLKVICSVSGGSASALLAAHLLAHAATW